MSMENLALHVTKRMAPQLSSKRNHILIADPEVSLCEQLRALLASAGYDYAVQGYVPRLVHAVQAGVFPDVSGSPELGNYTVRHLG